MRTSAPLIVTDYLVEKTSDPESGSVVAPGDVVTYTVTVTQQGDVPSGAVFRDDLSQVLDDAIWNDDVVADIGDVTFEDGILYWEGEIPVGGTATITYSVTVKDIEGLDADGDAFLKNVVWSPGCHEPDNCTTEHPVGWYDYSKTSEAAPGSTVQLDEVITYTVEIVQRGEGAIKDAIVTDDLTEVLDDAVWNDDAEASSGEVSYEEPILTWTGDLDVGDVVTLTYTVTVDDVGDYELTNVVTSPDEERSRCVPAPDENPDCTTSHVYGDYEVEKTSDPESGSAVEPGDVVTYTVEVRHVGLGSLTGWFEDDMTQVLDDATYNDDAQASAGEVSYDEPVLSWVGDLDVDDVVTVTYSVTVTAEGDRFLKNVVSTDGQCVPAEGQDEACATEHINGAYTFSKTADPEPGSLVETGEVVTYSVEISQIGTAPVEGAIITDDLSDVLDDATWNGDAEASSGVVSLDGTTLTWTGDLEVGQVVTLTYSVTVGDEMGASLLNVVTSPDERGVCVPAEDGNEDCTTSHFNAAYVFSKTSDPESGTTVNAGDVVTYTVVVEQVGDVPVEGAIITDDLSDVLDDAAWNGDAEASSGDASLDGTTLTWTGDLEVGQVVTVTYSVTVGDEMGASLLNVVTSPDERGVCVPAEDGNEGCTTSHFNAAYVFSKTSDPKSGTQVKEGDKVTYTVVVEHVGDVPVEGATVTDDLSQVSNVARWNNDAKATSGQLVREGTTLTWTGDLDVGQVVTLTYSVTVGDTPNAVMRNVVTSDDERAVCVDAADGNGDCTTTHNTPPKPPVTPPPGGPQLPDTGQSIQTWVLLIGAALLIGGFMLASATRRREEGASPDGSVKLDDLL
jgi:LPXTG-motif cell wall-anchored protein/uncharacterized repeat protein (TIGR01451 family)